MSDTDKLCNDEYRENGRLLICTESRDHDGDHQDWHVPFVCWPNTGTVTRTLVHPAEDYASRQPMLWIAYDPGVSDHRRNREQFNGYRPAWGETEADFRAKQGVDVPQVGDKLALRMGDRVAYERRLEAPETEDGELITTWYWTVLVAEPGSNTLRLRGL